jgi:hypothetical protein
MSTQHESRETLLMRAVQQLALPADEALAARPLHGSNPEALALEFDDLYTDYIDNLDELPSEAQLVALQALDSALTAMSGPANAELWTPTSVSSHPRWSEVRDLARRAIDHFGW